MGISAVHHVCIQTERYRESLDFYTKILGFEVIKETANFHKRDYNTWLRLGDFMIELQTAKCGNRLNKWSSQNQGMVHICFITDDVNKEYERIKKLGFTDFKVKDSQEIYKVEDAAIFKMYAPEGTQIEIRDK